jgi:hypothetical protein
MYDSFFAPVHLAILLLITFAFFVLPFWQIWKKAGFSPFLSLLMPVPVVGLVLLYVLAFAPWRPEHRGV